jgi:hypothetical protein
MLIGLARRNVISARDISSMMISNTRRFPLQWAVLATAYFLAVSCAGNAPMTSDLVSGSQVCLALDWGSGSPPNFFGWTAPDTMLLQPKNSKPLRHAQADAEGLVGVTASQSDRKGGGWSWFTHSDTLWISSLSPTDDLVIRAVRPTGRTRASWKQVGMGSEQGHVDLHPYPCGGLPESSP